MKKMPETSDFLAGYPKNSSDVPIYDPDENLYNDPDGDENGQHFPSGYLSVQKSKKIKNLKTERKIETR